MMYLAVGLFPDGYKKFECLLL